MEQAHKDVDGVPKLRGNAFYRCPSCMSGKLCTKLPGYHHTVGSTRNGHCPHTPEPSPDEVEDLINSVYLKDAMPGKHFHVDFGFVRGSDFKIPTKKGEGPTITSIDGKNSYCLINMKEPPVEPLRMILRKFGCNATSHRTIQTDQDKGLGRSLDIQQMLKDENFTLEVTGSESSKQNSLAERPHHDLAKMMRCMLHAAELGSEFWSVALAHVVYIKNRLPHSSINTTPFQAFTG